MPPAHTPASPDSAPSLRSAEEQARRMAERMRAVAIAGSGVIGARTLDDLQRVLQAACERVIGLDVFGLSVYDAERDVLSFPAGADLHTHVPAVVIPLAGTPAERVIRRRETLLTLSSDDPAGRGAVVVGTGRRSESIIRTPLLAGDRALGMLCVQSYTPGLYTDEDVEVLQTLAALAGTALLNVQYLAEREAAQRAVQESEERFRHLVTSLPSIVYMVEAAPPFHPMYVSPAAESLGYPVMEWIRRPDLWMSILHPDDRERVLEQTMAAQLAGVPLDYEYRVVAADGAVHWLRDTGSFVHDPAGRPLYWQGVMMDVTPQRQAEQAAREGEARYRALFEEVPVGIYRTLPDGRFLDANPALASILGFPDVESLMRRPATELYLDPGERNRWRAQADREGVTTGYELEFLTMGGERIWIRHSARAVKGPDGDVLYYEGSVEDITAHKRAGQALRESEEYFRVLTENSTETVAVLNRDATIRYSSAASGLPQDQARAPGPPRSAFSRVHPDDQAEARRAFRATLERPGGVEVTVLRETAGNGTWRTMEVTAKNLLDRPPVSGIVVATRDITERVGLEEQLRQASRMEAVGKLAGGIAHDFNNLLTAIRGNADLLLMDAAPGDPIREDLQEIRKAADRAAELIGQLLAFSRRQVLKPRVLRLNDRIEEMRKMLSRVIGEDVEIVTRLDAALGEVTADPTQMEQVILNLAVNARDAMRGGGTLTLQTCNAEWTAADRAPNVTVAPGAYVRLDVTDTGPGIAPEVLPHIFEPFYTTKPVGAGPGLGLATVQGVVDQSGGYVWAETWAGRGTRFTILLPRTDAPVPDADGPDEAPVEGSATGTLLLVEDEPSVRLLARKVLARMGYSVLEAENGEEAIRVAALHDGPIDLLVTDVVMPRLGGPEAARGIRLTRPGLRVVYMSGYAEDAVERHGVLEPGTAFVQKPFAPASLAQAVRQVLAGTWSAGPEDEVEGDRFA
ncbi:PAS domain S-box protein [Longimicrobium terrae]|uniref:histidine kinase n=1 Tax=Longimicrobium terrae TaxID=1639882 RepID=A0A841H1I5_9BACT|nr:PAS domain S-box protein [Longimicrobium terrae]MBB4637408.1 PAS domain S-box-containing protein [Longimicrobium terrae]MBB6071806.1 PAS domain S-box-containing protein [Longimicrobium terrae]NNC28565.1 PAS domain S-box protein [Longimicrobium terrae]